MKMKVTKSKSGSDMKSPIECAAWKAFLFKNRLPSEQGRALNGGHPVPPMRSSLDYGKALGSAR